jgi:hypothetical protein
LRPGGWALKKDLKIGTERERGLGMNKDMTTADIM